MGQSSSETLVRTNINRPRHKTGTHISTVCHNYHMTNTSLTVGPWKFKLHFGSDIVDFDVMKFRQTPSVLSTLRFVAGHQIELQQIITKAIKKEYQKAQTDREAFDPEFVDEILPSVTTDQQLLSLVTPLSVNIFETAKNKYHFVGFEFDCTWDEEHGIGITTYQTKLITHGGASTALTEWVARRAAANRSIKSE